jgi:hypothetical protein
VRGVILLVSVVAAGVLANCTTSRPVGHVASSEADIRRMILGVWLEDQYVYPGQPLPEGTSKLELGAAIYTLRLVVYSNGG